jgi:4'-phosphopantetheinyl transferase EntD
LEDAFAFVCTSYGDAPNLPCEPVGDFNAYLHPRELERIEKAIYKRKLEFLCGRLCAKRAYGRLCGNGVTDLPLSDQRLCVFNDCHGAPYFEDGRLSLSITHGDGLAAALVTDRNRLLAGIDLQKITPRGVQVIYRYLNDLEKALVERYSGIYSKDSCATAIWVAKEAASKLLGLGFSLFPALEVSCFEVSGPIQVRFKNFSGLTVVIRFYQDFLFGFAAEAKDAGFFYEDRLQIHETPLAVLKKPR